MKTTSKLIASISLSVLTIGAMAQIKSNNFLTQPSYANLPSQVVLNPKKIPAHSNKLAANSVSIQMAYWVDDANNVGTSSYSITGLKSNEDIFFQDQINGRFVTADTNKPSVPQQNFNLIRNAIVAFDTIMDVSGNGYGAQGMNIDTLWAGGCSYKNTSLKNDTLVFSIDSVTTKTPNSGYPTLKAYATYSVVLHRGVIFVAASPSGPDTAKFSGLTLDTLNSMWCIPNFALPRNHTKFSVSVSFYGSKADTFRIGYGFPLSQCTGGSCGTYAYANPFTTIGYLFTSKEPRTINVNSYANGWSYYYSGSPVILPGTDGTMFDGQQVPYNYEWNSCPGACTTDTMYLYQQDYAIYASVTFNNITGINNITASGLSVNQNYPNPFNKTTEITYNLVKSSDVVFSVSDITGRELVNNVYNSVEPGQHAINLNANTFAPGIYFYTFKVNGNQVTKKMVITE